MRRSTLVALAALAALALSACRSAGETPTLPPLARIAFPDFELRAELGPAGLAEAPDGTRGEPGMPEAQLHPVRASGAHRTSSSVPRIEVELKLVALDRQAVERLTGWREGDVRAFTTWTSSVERLLEHIPSEPEAELISTPVLAIRAGEQGTLRTVEHRAYVERFRVEQYDGTNVVDPVVGTFPQGLELWVRARPAAEGRISLELVLSLCDLCEPIPEHESRLVSKDAPFVIQLPVAASQHASGTVECGSQECLALVSPALDGTGRILFAFIAARYGDDGVRRLF